MGTPDHEVALELTKYVEALIEKVKNETENHYMQALDVERKRVETLLRDRDIIMAERDSIGFQLKTANDRIAALTDECERHISGKQDHFKAWKAADTRVAELEKQLKSDLHLERQIDCEYEVLSGYESLVSSLRAELTDAKATWTKASEVSVDAAARVLHLLLCPGGGTAHCCKEKPERKFYMIVEAVIKSLRSDAMSRDPREEKSIRQSLEEFRVTRYGVPVQLASSGAKTAGDDDGTMDILTNPSLAARIVSIFPDLVAYASDFRAMCDEWEKDGAGEPSRRKPRAGLANATIDEAKVLFGEAKDFCRRIKSMSGMIQVPHPPSPQIGHVCTGCQDSAKPLIQKDRVLFAALKDAAAAFKKIAGWAKHRETWGITLDKIEVEAAYFARFLSAYDEHDGKLSPAESRQFARGLREAARVGREEEIMVPILGELIAGVGETKRAWGIKVVEALCKMLEAKAAAIEGEVRP